MTNFRTYIDTQRPLFAPVSYKLRHIAECTGIPLITLQGAYEGERQGKAVEEKIEEEKG